MKEVDQIELHDEIKSKKLHCHWLVPSHRKYLIQRIKIYGQPQMITQQVLANQHYKFWLEQPKPLQSLLQHPLLIQNDHIQIEKVFQDIKKDQAKFGGYGTFVAISIYFLGLKRTATVRRIFNRRDYRIRNILYKSIAIYAIFIGTIMSFTTHFETKINENIKQKGLFKKYGIPTTK